MSQGNDVRRAALNIEEAALLPALPRTHAGGAALRTAMRAAEAMNEMQVGRSMTGLMGANVSRQSAAPSNDAMSAARRALTRAALHQVLHS